MSKPAFAGLAVSFALMSSASADFLYGIDISSGNIFTLDTTNGAFTSYPGHNAFSFGGLDFDSQGNLYMEQFGSLTKIDLGGGGDTPIGGNNGGAFESFEIIGDTGYAADVFDGGLYKIDLSNNNKSLVGFYGDTNSRITGLASNETDTMYGARIFQSDVIKVDPLTGANLGTIASGLPANVTSLAYGSNNNLWFIPAFETTLYSLDLGTGKVTPVLQGLPVSHVSGLTSDVRVPAPGAGALLAVAGLAGARRRR